MTASEMAQLAIGLGALFVALLALAGALVYFGMVWSTRRRNDRYDRRWGIGAYNEDAISRALAAVGAEARAGCTCEGCEHVRATVAEATFRLTDDDVAELNRYGIAWESR